MGEKSIMTADPLEDVKSASKETRLPEPQSQQNKFTHCDLCFNKLDRRIFCKSREHCFCPGCFEHWIKCDLSLSQGDGKVVGCPQLCKHWSRLTFSWRELALRVGESVFEAVMERAIQARPEQNECTKKKESDIARIVKQIHDFFNVHCPSCGAVFTDDVGRGCDAAWCSVCKRAFCMLCLRDCGDDEPVGDEAKAGVLIGDAHSHVKANDCGLTKGNVYNGHEVFRKVHERSGVLKTRDKLKHLSESKRRRIIRRLPPWIVELISSDSEEDEEEGGEIEWNEKRINESKLLVAAFNGEVETVKQLLDSGVNANCRDITHLTTPLHYAARNGNVEIMKMLLEKGADPNSQEWTGKTPLHSCLNYDSDLGTTPMDQVLEVLLSSNADKSLKTNGDQTPLDFALLFNRGEKVSEMLK